ncbi:MAG TPA: hypothetical protein VEA80_14145 [Vitreimonas sp.]|uniref:hypothetical protein n=1 Tax=Vitreimonas sp. TaxID=3069702 RepID=UPI002D6203BD|nr:hypothetical protein [Vitreimonas sp.]HYD88611.1 hypothetical protein [Vitreimonas sp.]
MKRYMLLHYGFEKPTPETMAAWTRWFEAVRAHTVEHGGFRGGRELSNEGAKELPFGAASITGYSILRAESIEEAQRLAEGNPFIAGIRIYEITAH